MALTIAVPNPPKTAAEIEIITVVRSIDIICSIIQEYEY